MPAVKLGMAERGPIELMVHDRGQGRPFVLVHGWPVASMGWRGQAEALLAAGHRVVTFDRRGFGASGATPDGYDADTLAEDLHRVLTSLELLGCTLVGHGTGCGEVVRYLGNFGAERICQAVLVSAPLPHLVDAGESVDFGGRAGRRCSADPADGLDCAGWAADGAAPLQDRSAFLAGFVTRSSAVGGGAPLVDDATLARLIADAQSASPLALSLSMQAWHTDHRDDLPRIGIPTLIVHGAGDHLLPPSSTCLPLQRGIAGSHLLVMDGAPHGLPWTNPARLNAELLAFAA